mgnify:CR=1 FL=1
MGLTASDRHGLALSAVSSSTFVCAWLISHACVYCRVGDEFGRLSRSRPLNSLSPLARELIARRNAPRETMVLTRSDSAASVWVLPPLAPDADGNYAIPDHRQLAQLCAVCVHNLALEPPLPSPAVGAAALDQDRRSLDWTAGGAIPTSQCDRDREGIRPLAGPSSSSNGAYHGPRRKRAASTATVAGEWAGAPAPTPDRILSSSSTVPSPPPPPPAFRRSVSAGMISTRGNNNTTRSSTIITAAAAPPASSTIDEEQEVTTSPAVAVVAADGPSEVARPSDSTIPTRRLRSTSRASVASSSGSTSTIRAAPRIPLRPPSDIVAGPSAASRQPQSTDSRPSQRRRAKQPKTRIPVPLVESFVSLELLPPLAAPDADGASVTEAATSKKMSTTRSRSGSVRSVFGGVGGGAAAAPSMSRSGSTGSVRGVAASSSSSSSSAIPSPRKRMRRRTISSAALFAPLPTLASLAAGNGANKSASPTTATETDDRADDDQGHPFYVSDVADPATHATFFLDPENCFLPSGPTTTTTNVDGDPTAPRNKDDCPRIAAFPEEIQDWPGWRQSRFKATLWGRREEEEGAKSRDRTAGRNGKQRQEMPNPPPAVAATSSSDGWRVLVEWEVDLAGLTSLGRDVSCLRFSRNKKLSLSPADASPPRHSPPIFPNCRQTRSCLHSRVTAGWSRPSRPWTPPPRRHQACRRTYPPRTTSSTLPLRSRSCRGRIVDDSGRRDELESRRCSTNTSNHINSEAGPRMSCRIISTVATNRIAHRAKRGKGGGRMLTMTMRMELRADMHPIRELSRRRGWPGCSSAAAGGSGATRFVPAERRPGWGEEEGPLSPCATAARTGPDTTTTRP